MFALLYVQHLAQALAIAFWKRTKSTLDHYALKMPAIKKPLIPKNRSTWRPV